MAKRFQPNRRLLKLLVGSNLYGSQDACIRELVQNAWDAIQLRKNNGDGQGGTIQIAYSVNEGWFEIEDDGIGMHMATVGKSFFEIGEDKLKVLEYGSRETQIGYFGIGILSVFLVADKFEVTTRHLNGDVIRFEVLGIDDEYNLLPCDESSVGTRIRIFPRSDSSFSIESIPECIRSYARHVQGITITSLDSSTTSSVAESWATDGLGEVHHLNNLPGVIAGRFGMSPALRRNTGTLSSTVTVCNAGFLTEADVQDLLPVPAIGMMAEIDLHPNALTMGMSRERIQRDTCWTKLGRLLQEQFIRFALEELDQGRLQPIGPSDAEEVKRTLLLWYHFLPEERPFLELRAAVERRIFETVPYHVADRSPSTLKNIFSKATVGKKLFYREVGRRTERTERIDDDGLPIRVSQEIRDSIRVGALRAKGFDVIELRIIQVNVQKKNVVETQQVPESRLVQKCLEAHGYPLINIVEASESDMDLQSIERLPVLRDALSVEGGLRFANVPDSMRRVITDSTGTKYFNLRNHDVQEILTTIPSAVSNPLKRRLLDAYLKMENFQFADARRILVDLLLEENLGALANSGIAPFTEKYIASLIEDLLGELGQ